MSELPVPPVDRVVYPESDGQPMGETGAHAEGWMDLVLVIRAWLADPSTYVGGNQFWYWVEGDTNQVFCPDVYVVPGRGQLPLRRVWKVWEEDGAVPALVIELTSKKTKATDLGAKRGLYEQLGVREYVMFDPFGDYLNPRLRMWRLEGDAFIELTGKLVSQVLLGAAFEGHGPRLRLRGPDGSLLPGPIERADTQAGLREQAEVRQQDAELRQQEAELRQQEAELHQQEAELRQQEAELRQQEAELRQQEAELRRQEAELRQQQAERRLEEALAEIARLRDQ
jgi:Uma2 family endonuclease